MKASDAVAKFLARHDINYCFELIGGMITHLIDSISLEGKTHIVSMHHEQGAAFAAEGIARQSRGKKLAVAMGTSGPGATNLITGIGSCWFDSVPCLFITGQVNTNELRGRRAIRQQGFQEMDVVEVVRSITKFATRIDQVEDLLPMLHLALSTALSGRMGPVLIDIPNNIQRMDLDNAIVEEWLARPLAIGEQAPALSVVAITAVLSLCKSARSPLVLIGGGARWADSLPGWLQRLGEFSVPYVTTLMGHEQVAQSPAYFGMIGSYGCRAANWAVQNCDLLLVLGSRLDVRQTGADVDDFARCAKVIQVDIDPAQLNNRVQVDCSLVADTESFLRIFPPPSKLFASVSSTWLGEVAAVRQQTEQDEYPDWPISPARLFGTVNRVFHDMAVDYVCDVGNHQMWAANLIRLSSRQSIHYSGGMGAMGFALPAAIGINLGSNAKTIVFTGDGSLQINIQELDTIVRMNLNITVIVLNNFFLGMVKNFQDMYFDGRNRSTAEGYSCPSFAAVGKAYGLHAVAVDNIADAERAIVDLHDSVGPVLIEIIMKGASECRPRLAFGSGLDKQYPPLGASQNLAPSE